LALHCGTETCKVLNLTLTDHDLVIIIIKWEPVKICDQLDSMNAKAETGQAP